HPAGRPAGFADEETVDQIAQGNVTRRQYPLLVDHVGRPYLGSLGERMPAGGDYREILDGDDLIGQIVESGTGDAATDEEVEPAPPQGVLQHVHLALFD